MSLGVADDKAARGSEKAVPAGEQNGASWLGLMAASLIYALSAIEILPHWAYLPVEEVWMLNGEVPHGTIGMGYYGYLFNAMSVFLVVWLMARLSPVGRWLGMPVRRQWVEGTAFCIVVLTLATLAVYEAGR